MKPHEKLLEALKKLDQEGFDVDHGICAALRYDLGMYFFGLRVYFRDCEITDHLAYPVSTIEASLSENTQFYIVRGSSAFGVGEQYDWVNYYRLAKIQFLHLCIETLEDYENNPKLQGYV